MEANKTKEETREEGNRKGLGKRVKEEENNWVNDIGLF
jgi:hypothetical protein